MTEEVSKENWQAWHHVQFDRNAVLAADATETSWDVDDLDRCEHGRHSIDDCSACPGGFSTGNLFLLRDRMPDSQLGKGGYLLIRIGTTVGAKPILIRPSRVPPLAQRPAP